MPTSTPKYRHNDYPFVSSINASGYNAGSGFRFGFNTQEKDKEVYNNNETYSATFWEYDGRLGRRWNVDPVFSPLISNYICFENNPNCKIDYAGNWPMSVHHKIIDDATSKMVKLGIITAADVKQLILGSDNADSPLVGPGILGNQSDNRQYIHGMKPKGMSNEDAIDLANKWIESNVKIFIETGDFEKLGEALHTIMDITSPAHRDKNGNPMVYEGITSDHASKEDPIDIIKNNGDKGYITEIDMKQRIQNSVDLVRQKIEESLQKRNQNIEDEKKIWEKAKPGNNVEMEYEGE
jgi:hypothetical protein